MSAGAFLGPHRAPRTGGVPLPTRAGILDARPDAPVSGECPGESPGECPGSVCVLPVDRIRASFAPLRPGEPRPRVPVLQAAPIRVVGTDDEHYEILDGFKRFERWSEAGYRWVPAILEAPMESTDLKRLLLEANGPPRTVTALDEARVVESLVKDDGLTVRTAAHLLGHKKQWAARRMLLATRLGARAQDELAHGRIGPSFAHALTALPEEDQDRLLEVVLAHRIRATDAVTLVHAYRVADETDRRGLLRDPEGTLRPAPSPVSSPRAAELEGRLEIFRRTLADLRLFTLPDDLSPGERRRLEALERSLHQELADTARTLRAESSRPQATQEKEVPHDTKRPTDERPGDLAGAEPPAAGVSPDTAAAQGAAGHPAGGQAGDRAPAQVLRNPTDRQARPPHAQDRPPCPSGEGRLPESARAGESEQTGPVSRRHRGEGQEGAHGLSHAA